MGDKRKKHALGFKAKVVIDTGDKLSASRLPSACLGSRLSGR